MRADRAGRNRMRRAVRIDKEDASDVLKMCIARRRMRGPAGDAASQCSGYMFGIERTIGKEPQGVGRPILICGSVVADPIDGCEGNQRVRQAEVNP